MSKQLAMAVIDRRNGGTSWRLGLGVVSLIAANIGLLLLFLAFDLSLFQLVLVFWCECLWIGVASGIKLLLASVLGSPYENRWAEVTPAAALFVSVLVLGFASGGFFSLLGVALMLILWVGEAMPTVGDRVDLRDYLVVVVGVSLPLLGGHAVSLLVNFLMCGEFRHARIGTLVALPFWRALALLLTIAVSLCIVSFVPLLASVTGFSAVLIALKLYLDLRLHMRERHGFLSAEVARS